MKPTGDKHDDHALPERLARAGGVIFFLVVLILWRAVSPTARRNRAWKNRMARQLGLATGTVLKREWNGVTGFDLSIGAIRPGTPHEALAELASAAVAAGYAREDFTARARTEGSHIYPPRGRELPSLWIMIRGSGHALCGQDIPPGHAGLSAALYGWLPGDQPRSRKAVAWPAGPRR